MFRTLAKILGKKAPRPTPTMHFAVFGKHPGWMDHMEELGLDTDLLIALRRMLYIDGINRNIDSGAWSQLPPEQVIETFNHSFIWSVRDEMIIGRLWSSSDGRGRKLYPMIACVHCAGVRIRSAMEMVLPRLERLRGQFISTETASGVRVLMKTAAAEFQLQAIHLSSMKGAPPIPGSALTTLADRAELGPDRQGLYRVLYQVEREMMVGGSNLSDTRSGTGVFSRVQHLRVPRPEDVSQARPDLWIEFLHDYLGGAPPVLMLLPQDQPWIDLIVGDPTAAQIFCLRATPEQLPLTTEVPYTIDETFRKKIEQSLAQAREKASGGG